MWAVEMAQLIKHLPHKHEESELRSPEPMQKARQVSTQGRGISGVHRPVSKVQRQKTPENPYWTLFWDLHIYPHPHVYTNEHVHAYMHTYIDTQWFVNPIALHSGSCPDRRPTPSSSLSWFLFSPMPSSPFPSPCKHCLWWETGMFKLSQGCGTKLEPGSLLSES